MPVAVSQEPLSNRISTFWTAMLSVATPETVRFPARTAALVGD